MRFSESDQALGKGREGLLLIVELIVQPVESRIQVICIVVTIQRAQKLVAAGHHGCACAEHQQGESVARSLALVACISALVPTDVVIASSIRRPCGKRLVVVLGVKPIEIGECKAVVSYQEVDRV